MASRGVHYRTEYCKFFQIGCCARGSHCAFAHYPEDVSVKVNLVKTALCHAFSIDGSCRRGSRCKFAHGEAELQPLDESLAAPMSKPQEGAEEWLESGAASAKMTMGTGKSKIPGLAKPQQWCGTSKGAPPGYVTPPGMEKLDYQTAELEQQAWEARSQIYDGNVQSLLNGKANVKSLKFRTNLCKFYFAGKCSRGMDCTFAHAKEHLMPEVDLRKGSLCFHFAQGCCQMGDSCKFAHGTSNLRQPSLRQAPELDVMPLPTQIQMPSRLLKADDSISESTTASFPPYGLEEFASFECLGILRL